MEMSGRQIEQLAVLQLSICRHEGAERGWLPGSQAASSNSLLMN
jgi:hypothetical protein